jgi:predicted amidohydrolase YtcJ
MKRSLLLISCFIFLKVFAQQKIDLLIYNATIYTVDENFSIKEAVAVNNGKIIATGAAKDLLEKYSAKEKIDVHGKFVYPGLIDAHAHFLEYGLDLQKVNLVGTTSWDEIIGKLKSYAEKNKEGWLTGSGWDQNEVINKDDFHLFGDYNIIPSVQPTHATSDMYWAGDRIGKERLKYSYAYNDLLKQNGWIPLGTDFPVEDISPIKTFYAAVVRKDAKGWPDGGFQMENALSRQDALRGMTIWAAKSNFEENEKGSLEKGKFADFIITDKDFMKVDAKDILSTQILMTFINGEKVFEKK